MITSTPSLPTHPPRPGPRRAISGDLAPSRAISGPRRRAISGDLGASLARRHTCSKKGRARLEPRGSRAHSRCAVRRLTTLCATCEALARAGEAAPRAPARLIAPLFFALYPLNKRERESVRAERGRPQGVRDVRAHSEGGGEPESQRGHTMATLKAHVHVMQHRPIPRASSSIEVFQEELRRCV